MLRFPSEPIAPDEVGVLHSQAEQKILVLVGIREDTADAEREKDGEQADTYYA